MSLCTTRSQKLLSLIFIHTERRGFLSPALNKSRCPQLLVISNADGTVHVVSRKPKTLFVLSYGLPNKGECTARMQMLLCQPPRALSLFCMPPDSLFIFFLAAVNLK